MRTQSFVSLIVPMPFEQWLAPKTRCEGFEVEGWYDWRVNNWGTKWDVCDVQMSGPLYLHDDEDADPATMNASFQFNCWTAWSPPIPVWDKLYEMGIRIHAEYQDEGMMFEGRWIDGVDESWEPEMEEEDA